MIANEKPDDLLRALASLASPAPATARDARIRARCHAAMTRREPPSSWTRPSWLRVFTPASGNGTYQWLRVFRPAPRAIVDALAAGAVVYGIAVIAEALKIVGAL